MNDFFELLPFIIGILYFVFGVGKKKKESSKPRSPRPKSPNRTTQTLEDILKELTGESSKPQTVPPAPPQHIPDPPAPKKVVADYEDVYIHEANTGKALQEIREEIREEQHLKQTKKLEVDLRKAVIYDAILNRPYD